MHSDLHLRCAVVLLFTIVLSSTCYANPYLENDIAADDNEEYDNNFDGYAQQPQDKRSDGSTIYMPMRRACVRRGENCDNRPLDCCYNSSCRCNLWGSNCKCQRKGLFRKWGK